jgi:hypothetical protein
MGVGGEDEPANDNPPQQASIRHILVERAGQLVNCPDVMKGVTRHMADRQPRYGFHTYRVRVNTASDETGEGVVYVGADSLTVTPAGALILAIEQHALEDFEEAPDGELRLKADASGIDVPPVAVFAPGQWYSAILVDPESHEPLYGGDLDEEDEEQ